MSYFDTRFTRPDIVPSLRPAALHIFSDTLGSAVHFPPLNDFDAGITSNFRHGILDQHTRVGTAGNPLLAAYGAELIVSLQDEAARMIDNNISLWEEQDKEIPYYLLKQRKFQKNRPQQVLLNYAPRDKKPGNGTDFYYGITDNNVELFTTPLELLSYVRDRIVRLWRVPNEDNGVFDPKEQFRSSIVGNVRNATHRLDLVYDAINGHRENPIPPQEHDTQIAYVDRFGNLRLRVKDISRIEIRKATHNVLALSAGDKAYMLDTAIALKDARIGQLSLYKNIADRQENAPEDTPGYLELAVRKEDPESEDSAYTRLLQGGATIGTPISIHFPQPGGQQTFQRAAQAAALAAALKK